MPYTSDAMAQPGPEFQRVGPWRDQLGPYRGALTLPVTDDGRVLLQLRDDIPGIIKPGMWCFFGGGIETGEDPHDAVAREFEEETGLSYPKSSFAPKYAVLNGEPSWGLLRVYQLRLDRHVNRIVLNEGSGFGLCTQNQAVKLDIIPSIRSVLDKFWADRDELRRNPGHDT